MGFRNRDEFVHDVPYQTMPNYGEAGYTPYIPVNGPGGKDIMTVRPNPAYQDPVFPDQHRYGRHSISALDSYSRSDPGDCYLLEENKLREYFIDGSGIEREVIEHEISRYLGADATVRPFKSGDREGYLVRAYRGLTAAMLEDLKGDSIWWRKKSERTGKLSYTEAKKQRPYEDFEHYEDYTRSLKYVVQGGATDPRDYNTHAYAVDTAPSNRTQSVPLEASGGYPAHLGFLSKIPGYGSETTTTSRRTLGGRDVHSGFGQALEDSDKRDGIQVQVLNYTAIALIDSGSSSNFISAEFCRRLGKTPIKRPPGSRDFCGASGERLSVTGIVEVPVSWGSRCQFNADISFNVAENFTFDMIITSEEGATTGMDTAAHRVQKREAIGTVAPIKPVSSTYIPPRRQAQVRGDERDSNAIKERNKKDEDERRKLQQPVYSYDRHR